MEEIKSDQPHLLLVEGIDAKYFLMHFLNFKNVNNVQVRNYNGITELTRYLETLRKLKNYDRVKSMIIIRDAEKSAVSAMQSINHSLMANKISDAAISPFKIEHKTKDLGIMLFPGLDENKKLCEEGTLEDLCLKLFNKHEIIENIEPYLEDFQEKNIRFSRLHKNKLHVAFSFTNEYVGLKLGETARAQGFNFESQYLEPFLHIIMQVSDNL
jgi:hypothetical protein